MVDISPDQARELAIKLSWQVEREMFNNSHDDCPRRKKCEEKMFETILMWSLLSNPPLTPVNREN